MWVQISYAGIPEVSPKNLETNQENRNLIKFNPFSLVVTFMLQGMNFKTDWEM